jgi:hypothetical protein
MSQLISPEMCCTRTRAPADNFKQVVACLQFFDSSSNGPVSDMHIPKLSKKKEEVMHAIYLPMKKNSQSFKKTLTTRLTGTARALSHNVVNVTITWATM